MTMNPRNITRLLTACSVVGFNFHAYSGMHVLLGHPDGRAFDTQDQPLTWPIKSLSNVRTLPPNNMVMDACSAFA